MDLNFNLDKSDGNAERRVAGVKAQVEGAVLAARRRWRAQVEGVVLVARRRLKARGDRQGTG